MKKLLTSFIFLISLLSMKSYAQDCGTIITDAEYQLASATAHFGVFSQEDAAVFNEIQYIPIQIHIVRESNRIGGISIERIRAALDITNQHFADANMQFVECGKEKYIDNSTYTTMLYRSDNEYEMANANNVANVINIYFIDDLRFANGATGLCGYSVFPFMSEDWIIMDNDCVDGGSILSHEIGHYFYLFHTHETAFGRELVNRSNCSQAGDLLCDTPADPKLSGLVSNNCVYIGNWRDANSQLYQPDPTNLMSYSRSYCIDNFTSEQIQRMQTSYLQDRNYLECGTVPPTPPVACDIIKNGSFDNGLDNWDTYINSAGRANFYTGYNNAYVYNLNGGTSSWHVQLYQKNLDFPAGNRYVLSFDARAFGDRSITVDISRAVQPHDALFYENVDLSTSWERKYIVFETEAAFNNARLVFNLGKSNTGVLIDNVKIEKDDCFDECNLLQNSYVENDITVYEKYVNSAANAYTTFNQNEGSVDCIINNPGTSTWHVQVMQRHFPIKAGKYYTISYKAKSTIGKNIYVDISKSSQPHNNYFGKTEWIGSSWKTYNYTFYSPVNDNDARFVFNIGKYAGSVSLDNVMIIERNCYEDAGTRLPQVADVLETNVTVAPNPFTDYINISTAESYKDATVQIYDIQGKLVVEDSFDFENNSLQTIQTSDLINGIYIIKVQAPYEKPKTFKIIKNEY